MNSPSHILAWLDLQTVQVPKLTGREIQGASRGSRRPVHGGTGNSRRPNAREMRTSRAATSLVIPPVSAQGVYRAVRRRVVAALQLRLAVQAPRPAATRASDATSTCHHFSRPPMRPLLLSPSSCASHTTRFFCALFSSHQQLWPAPISRNVSLVQKLAQDRFIPPSSADSLQG